MWGFEAFAEGLSTAAKDSDSPAETSSPPQQLHKHYRNNDLFDAGGKLLDAETAHHATTWRSHHAFSGRCALVSPITAAGPQAQPQRRAFHAPAWAEQAWSAYQSWSVGFRLRSVATDEPHILLSVAPAYFPNLVSATGETREADAETLASMPCPPSAEEEIIYNHRVLETPLIWEEPYALSVECTPHGLFLWSDQWGIFGKKVADRCLEARSDLTASSAAAGEGASSAQPCYAAALRLHWRAGTEGNSTTATPTPPTLSVELQTEEADAATAGSTASATPERSGNAVWRQVVELPLPLDGVSAKATFRPYVTLMEGGDSVELL